MSFSLRPAAASDSARRMGVEEEDGGLMAPRRYLPPSGRAKAPTEPRCRRVLQATLAVLHQNLQPIVSAPGLDWVTHSPGPHSSDSPAVRCSALARENCLVSMVPAPHPGRSPVGDSRRLGHSQVLTKICKAQIEAMLQDVRAEVDRLKTGATPVAAAALDESLCVFEPTNPAISNVISVNRPDSAPGLQLHVFSQSKYETRGGGCRRTQGRPFRGSSNKR